MVPTPHGKGRKENKEMMVQSSMVQSSLKKGSISSAGTAQVVDQETASDRAGDSKGDSKKNLRNRAKKERRREMKRVVKIFEGKTPEMAKVENLSEDSSVVDAIPTFVEPLVPFSGELSENFEVWYQNFSSWAVYHSWSLETMFQVFVSLLCKSARDASNRALVDSNTTVLIFAILYVGSMKNCV